MYFIHIAVHCGALCLGQCIITEKQPWPRVPLCTVGLLEVNGVHARCMLLQH
jgi:hypothetical protein